MARSRPIDFEVILNRVFGRSVFGRNRSAVEITRRLHCDGLIALRLIHVAIVEAYGFSGFFKRQIERKHLTGPER